MRYWLAFAIFACGSQPADRFNISMGECSGTMTLTEAADGDFALFCPSGLLGETELHGEVSGYYQPDRANATLRFSYLLDGKPVVGISTVIVMHRYSDVWGGLAYTGPADVIFFDSTIQADNFRATPSARPAAP